MEWPSYGLKLDELRALTHGLGVRDVIERFGDAFFVRRTRGTLELPAPTRTLAGFLPVAPERSGEIVVYAVRRQPDSLHAFVSIGRLDKNDVALRDESVSKFHAFLRERPGALELVDAKSTNGTSVDGQPVPQQGAGAGPVLRVGQVVRFGGVFVTFVDAHGLQLLTGARRHAS